MNLLTDQLPTAVMINGKARRINTDFRACLRVILAYEDDELTGIEKQAILLENLYPERPDDIDDALTQGVKFLNGGKDEEDGEGEGSGLRLYSFSKDAGFIFAAFRQTHGIDLETEDMHWWKFLALFMDLGAETSFSNLVSLRKRLKTGKATKEERAAAREMKDMVYLPEPDTRTPEEREAEAVFLRLVEEGKRNAKNNS